MSYKPRHRSNALRALAAASLGAVTLAAPPRRRRGGGGDAANPPAC